MDQPVSFLGVLEVVDRAGHVHTRVRVERLPFRIGRALDNDLILDDVHACPQHAELLIDEQGLALVDRASVNGSFKGHERQRAARIDLSANTDLRLGHTLLRFRSVNEQLAATLADPLASSRLLGLDRGRWALGALLISALVLTAQTVIGSARMLHLGALAGSVLPALVVLAVWALCWSLVNRVVGHRFHYLGHLAIAGLGVIAAAVFETSLSYLRFAIAADGADPLGTLFGAVLLSVVVYGHLRLISRGRGRRLLLPAGIVGVGFLALMLLPDASDSRFQAEPQLGSPLKPPFAALRSGRAPERYYADAVSIFDEADAAAEVNED